MNDNSEVNPLHVLNSISEGVYVTDMNRKILYWSASAEKITGWTQADIEGKHCHDDLLCHIDKDGHLLCGKEHCPLHRSIQTEQNSTFPIIVFAQTKNRGRVPLQVSVSPVRNDSGKIVGGVETFRDFSVEYAEAQRVKKIQALCLEEETSKDDRIDFLTHYQPNDVIGGDYYSIKRISEYQYGFILADVTGHGVPAALYTMYLNSLWNNCQQLITEPKIFAKELSKILYELIKEDQPFAAATCGYLDLKEKKFTWAGAGNPPALLIRNGEYERLSCSGFPLGCLKGMEYKQESIDIQEKDRLLLYTDGIIDIHDEKKERLGPQGLEAILKKLNYAEKETNFNEIEEALLTSSNHIRFNDDITFIEIRINNFN